MTRLTVSVLTPGDSEPRDFHLSPEKAERFAARIRAEGGTATIGPFKPNAELSAMLSRVGAKVA